MKKLLHAEDYPNYTQAEDVIKNSLHSEVNYSYDDESYLRERLYESCDRKYYKQTAN